MNFFFLKEKKRKKKRRNRERERERERERTKFLNYQKKEAASNFFNLLPYLDISSF